MTPYELMTAVGGELVRGQIRHRVGPDYVVLARLNGDRMELTEAGRQTVASLDTGDAKVKPKRTKVDLDDLRPLPPEGT